MRTALGIILSLVLLPRLAAAQSLEFSAPTSVADPKTPAVMRDLASRIIPGYRNDRQEQYLANMSALQLVAGSFDEAYSARLDLRQLRGGTAQRPPADPALVYDLYAHAKALQAQYRLPFAQAFDLAFWETMPIFDNLDGYRVETWLQVPPAVYADALQASFDSLRGHERISEPEALTLIWQYVAFDAYRSFGPIVPGLISLDDDRRYNIQDDVAIDVPGHGKVLALLIRPRSATGMLTTLLQYRIAPGGYDDALEAAAYGFASVVAFTPAVRAGRHSWQVIPFEGEGDRARAVIDWIAKQTWGDAQVGMYGDGYSGFVAWAVAKRLPSQLKGIATSDAMAPGVNFPMDGGIGQNAAYCWLQRVETEREESDTTSDAGPASIPQTAPDAGSASGTSPTGAATQPAAAGAPTAAPGSPDWCSALNDKWYASGKPYRDLPRLAGRPSPVFQSWLAHPAYDAYWRRLVPSPQEFAHVDIPILSLTGYYSAGEAGTLFYFLQHYAHDPQAAQMLLAGPYDHSEMRGGRAEQILRDYHTDPAAVIDLRGLELQWFAYLFLNQPKPTLLSNRVNFEVMGANAWQHTGTLDTLANDRVRLYFAAEPRAGSGSLTPREPTSRETVNIEANLARRKDDGEAASPSLMTGSVPVENGFAFVSGPLPGGLDIAGAFSGRLLLRTNKRDLDLTVSLYELLPDGNYFHLFAPAEEFRASYLRDPGRRQLLTSGAVQSLTFTGRRITAVRVESGARLVLVLRVSKRPDREINYGSGRTVSGESSAAGRVPVKLGLLRGSYVDLAVTEQGEPQPRVSGGH
jgi:hypothetical protein